MEAEPGTIVRMLGTGHVFLVPAYSGLRALLVVLAGGRRIRTGLAASGPAAPPISARRSSRSTQAGARSSLLAWFPSGLVTTSSPSRLSQEPTRLGCSRR